MQDYSTTHTKTYTCKNKHVYMRLRSLRDTLAHVKANILRHTKAEIPAVVSKANLPQNQNGSATAIRIQAHIHLNHLKI